ncbi:putative cytoplasmic protein NCK1-like [Apostichopus japonicus]|uniref:Putative cytoplasmic protein NCK1-like n=1 Tax=Stichopus japonicus TaxID=307972 RepID=A0A2G8K499_STIJA|nr:putative cytoplasmic protein NCK1-like [Apostichopus japonicus]
MAHCEADTLGYFGEVVNWTFGRCSVYYRYRIIVVSGTAGNSPHSEGESKRAEQPGPLTAHDYQPSESPDRSFVTIPESYPQLSSRRDLISETYPPAHADIGAPPTNLYNDLPVKSPNKSNIYSSKPFIRKDDHGNKLVGLQCIVTKDFTAENPSEIDLYLNDWVELQRIDGNSYYGSVFSRSGQCEGWFHKSHVEVIPDSKVGSLTFRYVVRAEVNYLTEEAGFFSYRCGDKFDVLEEQVSVEEDRKHAYYRVRNKSGEMGLVVQLGFTKCQGENPVLNERQWYYPKMTRMEAEEELRASNADTFLVRDSSHALGNFTISVRGQDRVLHVIVITHRRGYQTRQDKFKSLDEILDFYRAYPIIRNVRLLNSLQPEAGHFYQNLTHDLT